MWRPRLEHRPYLAGDEMTAADIMMGFTLATAKWLNLLTDSHPRASAYVNRLFERPAVQRALA